MALRYRRLRQIPTFLSHIYSGSHGRGSSQVFRSVAFESSNLPCVSTNTISRIMEKRCHLQRFSSVSEVPDESTPGSDVLSFVKSTFDNLEGPAHCWLNKGEVDVNLFKKGRAFFVLAGEVSEDSLGEGSDLIHAFKKLKFLQQRFPWLGVMALLSCSSVCSASSQARLRHLIMEEFITFPILLSNNNFGEVTNGPSFLLVKDLKSTVAYPDKDLDLGILIKFIEESDLQPKENSLLFSNSGSVNAENVKEPHLRSSLQNLFLYFPGCIAADESGNRFFLSDCNHHRIIVADRCGKILDCIGSSPGFDDGEFESAKLLRPAGSFYDAAEDCLYFVDSENHAVRRADMERRVLETLYPTSKSNRNVNKFWTWMMDKLGFEQNVSTKPEKFDTRSLMFPWHLLKSMDNNFIIISRNFETLWIMDSASGEIAEVVGGLANIFESYGHLILEKVSLLETMPHDLLRQKKDTGPLGRTSFASLLSSFTTMQDDIILCDTVGQKVLKFNRQSGACSNIQFSNFGALGLPYWLSYPLERVYDPAGGLQVVRIDHVQSFNMLPGRIDIQLYVDIPEDTELVGPLQDSCIWRQARGAATEVSRAEWNLRSLEKVGAAQQWYDELDYHVKYKEEPSSEENSATLFQKGESITNSQGRRIHIDCAVNTSPGTSEVIIYAPLYMKLRYPSMDENDQTKHAERIADILGSRGGASRAFLIHSLLKSNKDLRDFIFMRPLYVKIKFDCLDHPKEKNQRDIILTDSIIEVNASLST